MGHVLDDDDAEDLTVGRAAATLGVTVRTLHHWDEVGLAGPSSRSAAGYRLYDDADLERLRRIVVYRELGLDLEAIRRILEDRSTEVVVALRDQQTRLAERIARLRTLHADLEHMIRAHEHGLLLSEEEQTSAFGPSWDPQWPAEARQRYGENDQWREFAERSATRTAADWHEIADATRAVDQAMADAMDAGVEPGSPAADALVERHRMAFSQYFSLSREMQVCLGRMYEADPGFAAHYEAVHVGLAGWLRQSIDASARSRGIDPDTASWQ
jgi:DNA-binding transcriptional MerR regulator